jgi:hypothetical protein
VGATHVARAQIYTGFEREGAFADALMLGHGLECDDAWAWRPRRCKGGVVIPALLPLLQTVWIVWDCRVGGLTGSCQEMGPEFDGEDGDRAADADENLLNSAPTRSSSSLPCL